MVDTAVDVPIVNDKSKAVEVTIDKGGDDKGASKIVTAEEGIESLKSQVEKAKRDSAERLAAKDRIIADAFKQANEAQREVVTVKRDQVGTILEKLTSDKDAARRDLIAAHEAGDFAKVADAQDRLSMANARIVEAEKGKMALEEEVRNPPRQTAPRASGNTVEDVAQTFSPAAANWIRQHPEHVVNGGVSDEAIAAHNFAVARGCAPDSPAYFDAINNALGSQPRQEQPRQETQLQGRDMSRAPTSAPVGRDVAQVPGATRPGFMRLSQSEAQSALDTFGPLYPKATKDELYQMYAKEKTILIDEGKIARRAS